MSPDALEGCDQFQLLRPAVGPEPLESFVVRDLERDGELLLRLFPTHLVADDEALEQLRTSLEPMAELDHHNVAAVAEVGRLPGGRAFVASELADGRLLREVVRTWETTLPVLGVIELACAVLAGLQAAHDRGVVHGAVSLDTLCLCPVGGHPSSEPVHRVVKVLDFGLAAALAREGVAVVAHVPPIEGEGGAVPADPRDDVMAVGVVIYELLTGRNPLAMARDPGDPRRAAKSPPAAPSRYSSSQDTGPELDAVVLRSLEPDPDDRYQSALAFRAALEKVAALLRQVSLPGNLHLAEGGYSVELGGAADPGPPVEVDGSSLAFSAAPQLDDEAGPRSNRTRAEGTSAQALRAGTGRVARVGLLALVAGLIAVVVLAAYLAT